MAIEFPWIEDVFGEFIISKVHSMKLLDLNLSFNDTYSVDVLHNDGHFGSLNFDVVSRTPTRELKILNEDSFISWNGNPNGLFTYNLFTNQIEEVVLYDSYEHSDKYADYIVEDAYKDEVNDFFSCVSNHKSSMKYSFSKDIIIQKKIDLIQELGNDL